MTVDDNNEKDGNEGNKDKENTKSNWPQMIAINKFKFRVKFENKSAK